jgi:peptidoglycan/xylan/chitin deacetylase (PgdA/CDA1 family)
MPFSDDQSARMPRRDRMSVVLTVDTEPDDAWADQLCPSVSNVRALRRLDELLRRYGAKATLLVTYRVVQDAECRDILRGLVAESGAEVGAHLHPWETPPFMPSGIDVKHPTFPHELPLPVFTEKLSRLTEAITERIGPPTSYRAGRWGLAAEHLRVLEDLGYEVDTSVYPLMDWRRTPGIPWREAGRGGVDYRFAPQEPYRPSHVDVTRPGPSRIVELPVTAGFTRRTPARLQRAYVRLPEIAQRVLRKCEILRPVWATPAWETRAHLERMIRAVVGEGRTLVNIACHSSEFTVSRLPECSTPERVDEVFRRTEAMLQILVSQAGCEFTTLTAAGRQWLANQPGAVRREPQREARPAIVGSAP